ncbi:patatin-like phospholipase family protein [Roseovarius nitratireducens]
MSEAGIPVDYIGGTSVGAAMAAAIAQGSRPKRSCAAATRYS